MILKDVKLVNTDNCSFTLQSTNKHVYLSIYFNNIYRKLPPKLITTLTFNDKELTISDANGEINSMTSDRLVSIKECNEAINFHADKVYEYRSVFKLLLKFDTFTMLVMINLSSYGFSYASYIVHVYKFDYVDENSYNFSEYLTSVEVVKDEKEVEVC